MSSRTSQQLRQMMEDFIHRDGMGEQKATDQLYYAAFQNCRFVINILNLYTFALVAAIACLLVPFFPKGIQPLQLYLSYLFLVTILRLYHYNSLRLALKEPDNYYKIAQITQHMNYVLVNELPQNVRNRNPLYLDSQDFRDPDDPDIQRKLRTLSHQIKVATSNINRNRRRLNKIQFVLYQISHFLGILFLLYFNFDSNTSAKILISIIVLVGTYQYVQFYLLMIFVAIVLPYYFFRQLWLNIRDWNRRRKLQKILQSERFSQKGIQGDHQCKICLMEYQQNDRVIVLKCNKMHNFHSICLKQWLKSAVTCPLCRTDLTTF